MADTSNIAEIQAALVDIIQHVDGIANVKSGCRLALDWGTFVAQFRQIDSPDQRVNGWTVQWAGMAEERISSAENKATHRFLIKGYYSLRPYDATESTTSEEEFDAIIAGIGDGIRATHTITGTTDLSQPIQMPVKREVEFAGVLVHYCELTLEAVELLLGD